MLGRYTAGFSVIDHLNKMRVYAANSMYWFDRAPDIEWDKTDDWKTYAAQTFASAGPDVGPSKRVVLMLDVEAEPKKSWQERYIDRLGGRAPKLEKFLEEDLNLAEKIRKRRQQTSERHERMTAEDQEKQKTFKKKWEATMKKKDDKMQEQWEAEMTKHRTLKGLNPSPLIEQAESMTERQFEKFGEYLTKQARLTVVNKDVSADELLNMFGSSKKGFVVRDPDTGNVRVYMLDSLPCNSVTWRGVDWKTSWEAAKSEYKQVVWRIRRK